MIFNTQRKLMGELENEILEANLETFVESFKEDCSRNQELEQINQEDVDPVCETYEPVDKELLDEFWRQEIRFNQ